MNSLDSFYFKHFNFFGKYRRFFSPIFVSEGHNNGKKETKNNLLSYCT